MARYDTMRKLERNRALVEYRNQHPEMSWAEIGAQFEVTCQRAWEICKNETKKKATYPAA